MSHGYFPKGYYDDNGEWQRHVFCHVSCGDQCTCMPPLGVWYSAAHDKRIVQGAATGSEGGPSGGGCASGIETPDVLHVPMAPANTTSKSSGGVQVNQDSLSSNSETCPHTKVFVTDSTMRRNKVPCPWCKDAEIERLRSELWNVADMIWSNSTRDDAKHWAQNIRVSLTGGPGRPESISVTIRPVETTGSDSERTLRRLLAFAYSAPGELYGDDGELQNGAELPVIDFKRDSVVEIERKIHERGMRKLAKAGVIQPVETSERPCTCHPDDNPPRPCPRKYALSECRKASEYRDQVNALALECAQASAVVRRPENGNG